MEDTGKIALANRIKLIPPEMTEHNVGHCLEEPWTPRLVSIHAKHPKHVDCDSSYSRPRKKTQTTLQEDKDLFEYQNILCSSWILTSLRIDWKHSRDELIIYVAANSFQCRYSAPPCRKTG